MIKKLLSLLTLPALVFSFVLVATAQETYQMPPEVESCVKSAIGAERYQAFRAGEPMTQEEKTKAQPCFSGSPEGTAPPTGTTAKPEGQPKVEMDPQLVACMKEAIGEDRYNALSTGEGPSDADRQAGMECFKKLGKEPPAVDVSKNLSASVMQCLKLAVGTDRFNAISKGESPPTLEERRAGEKCFGAQAGPISQEVKAELSSDVAACLKKAVGEDRYNAISKGESTPTPDEHKAGTACFKKSTGTTAKAILPPASGEVPYLPEKPDTVSIDETAQKPATTSRASSRSNVLGEATAKAVTLKGKASANGVVDIFIYSEPTTAATQADASGNWSYTIERDLPTGKHLAYATTKVKGETVRSKEKSFEVAQLTPAPPPPPPATQVTKESAPVGSPLSPLIPFAIAAVVFLLVLVGLLYFLKRSHKAEAAAPAAESEQKPAESEQNPESGENKPQ